MVAKKTSRKRRTVEVTEIRCEHCGNWFEALSHRAAYCSDACRQAAHRERKRQEK